MTLRHEVGAALRALLRRGREEREMDEELRFHLEMEARQNERAGLPPDEARRRAVRAFGGVERVKDEVRDERSYPARAVDEAAQDVRFAWRSLRRRPAFTAVAALTLALGIGATTTLFGVVKAVLLTPLPFGRPEGVAMVWSSWKDYDRTWVSYDEWEAYEADVRAFADVGLFNDNSITLAGGGAEPERIRAGAVNANVFHILGVEPMLGRGFAVEEDRPNGPAVIVLGFDLWQRRFGADPGIVGRTIEVGGKGSTVVGVMPPGFRLPLDYGADGKSEAWQPLGVNLAAEEAVPGAEAMSHGGGSHQYYAVARLAPGATVERANAEIAALVARHARDGVYPESMRFRAFAVPVEEQVTGRVRPALLVVFGAVGFVLLIACANVAGLLLVRGEGRRRELAVRVALGAGARRLTRLLLAESLVLAAMGGALGVALAAAGVGLVRRTTPAALPRVAETTLDGGVLLFAVALAACAALLSGVLPALHATRVAPAAELKEGGRAASAGPGRLRWRQTLVAAEVALAVILVAGAGLMIRSVANLFAIDPGFRPDGVLTMRLSTPAAWYPDSVRVAAFYDELGRRVAAIPGVRAAGAVFNLPLATQMGDWGLSVEGYGSDNPHRATPSDWQVVTPGYFEAMGLRLRAGRFFEPRDGMSAPLVLIVNRRFAETYFAGRQALGGRVRVNGAPDSAWATVVGVVDDVHHNALVGDAKPQFYAPLAQFAVAPGVTWRNMSLAVRAKDGDPAALAAPVRAAIRSIDPRLPVSAVRTMEDVVGESIAAPRFAMELLGVFGVLALVLSAIGIFGIVAQVVASRAHEFGIRVALGAEPREIVMLSLRTGVRQVAAGLAAGVAGALLLTRAMTTLLHGVAPTDPATFAGVVALTGLVALAASVGPATRAGRANPAAVLHEG